MHWKVHSSAITVAGYLDVGLHGYPLWTVACFAKSKIYLVIQETLFVEEPIMYFVHSKLQTSMNARMVTMEVALTNVPIPMEATNAHADVVMNSREKMKHLEVEMMV